MWIKVKKEAGMTVIELLAVIAIIAILMVLLIPKISGTIEKARITGLQTDFNSYRTMGKSYFMENIEKEKEELEFNKYLDKPLRFNSGESQKKNPWGETYKLLITNDKNALVISTKDKKEKEYILTISMDENGEIYYEMVGWGEKEREVCIVENQEKEEFFEVEDVTGGVQIIAYTGTKQELVIPCEINKKNVVDIGSKDGVGAFQDKKLTAVTLPNTLGNISGQNAFAQNYLTQVSIPNKVKTIGDRVFQYNNLTALTIPKNVTEIGVEAFSASPISAVTIHENLTKIGASAFSLNPTISYVVLLGNPNYKHDQNNAGVYTKDGKGIVLGTKNVEGTALYENIEEIHDGAFYGNQIQNITIASKVKRIGDYAFQSNELKTIGLPEGLKEIGQDSFSYNDLRQITLPSTLENIGSWAFYGNLYLDTVINKSNLNVSNYFDSNPTITKN